MSLLTLGQQLGGKWISAQAGELQTQRGEKRRIVDEVALPQAARLLTEAVSPLQSCIFNPLRSIFEVAGVNVESGADSDHDFDGEALEIRRHELFLLRRAESHPNNIGMCGFDLLFERELLGGIKRSEGRSEGPYDSETRNFATQGRGEFIDYARHSLQGHRLRWSVPAPQ